MRIQKSPWIRGFLSNGDPGSHRATCNQGRSIIAHTPIPPAVQTEIKPRGGYFLVWAPTAADLEILAGWVRQGKLHSVIDSIYPLELIRDAHERSQTERARGKIVLRIKD